MIRRALLGLAVAVSPVAAQTDSSSIGIGFRGGVEVHRGGTGHKHLGFQVWIPISNRLQLVPAVDALRDFPDDPLRAWSGSAWRGYVSLRGHPFGSRWVPEIGYGLSARYARATNAGRSISASDFDLTDAAVLAFAGPRWRVRPYTELYLVNVLRRAGQVRGLFFLGLRASLR